MLVNVVVGERGTLVWCIGRNERAGRVERALQALLGGHHVDEIALVRPELLLVVVCRDPAVKEAFQRASEERVPSGSFGLLPMLRQHWRTGVR